MALSGSFNTTAYSGRYLTFSWTATQNVAANTSTISWRLVGAGTGSGYYMSGNFKVVIAGETVYQSTTRIELRVGTVVATGTKVLTHNSDGTKTFSASAEAGIYTVAVNCRGSGNFTLNTIPRASTVTATNGTINDWATVNISRASSAFTHTVSATFGSITTGIATKTNQTSISWVIPSTWYSQIPNAKSGTATVTCQTYNGDTLIGTSTTTFTASIDEEDCTPTLSPFVYDTNDETIDLTGDDTRVIRYHSNMYCEANPTAKNSASIQNTVVQCGTSAFVGNSHTFNDAESGNFTFITTDTRGLTRQMTENLTVVNYIHLTCVMKDSKPDTSGNFTFEVDGNCFNGSFGVASNTLTVQYRYKAGSGSYSAWANMTVSRSGNTYSATVDITGLDYTQTYTFQARATDQLETITTDETAVKTLPVFDWSGEDFNFNVPVNFSAGATGISGGGGLAYGTCSTIGGTSTKVVNSDDFGDTLETGKSIRVKFIYANTVASPYLNVNGTGAKLIKKYGSTGSVAYYWYTGEVIDFVYDGSYWVMVNAAPATTTYYGITKLQSTISNTDTVALTPGAVYDFVKQGTWTPTVTGCSTYSLRQGWYSKIGDVVSIGWCVTGTFSTSTTTSTTLTITGLPFACGDALASGGGVVFNGWINTDGYFVGWAIAGGESRIQGRTADSSHAAGGIGLGSGLYNNPGAVFTVAGSITYSVA